jgi:peptidoglycan/LPS O-acetylase OafA/YrhL
LSTHLKCPKAHIRPLTALRFYAAFIVFSLHASMLPGLEWLGHPQAPLQGHLGVSVFFVLSGFIMTHVYYGEDKYVSTLANSGRFIIARISRIFPLHLITLLICLPLGLNSNTAPIQVQHLPIHIVLLQEWSPFGFAGFGPNKVSWTLSTEMFFYLSTPIIFALMLRTGRRKMLILASLFAAIAIATMYFYIEPGDPSVLVHAERAPFRLADYILGIMAFLFYQRFPTHDRSWMKWLLPLGILWFASLMAAEYYRNAPTPGSPLFLPGCLLVVLGIAFRRDTKSWFLASDRIVFLGEASFAFYMVHELILRYGRQILLKLNFEIHGLLYIPWFIFVYSMIQLVANQIHLHVEIPLNTKGRKWLTKIFRLE